MGDAIESMLLEEQMRQFVSAGVTPGDYEPGRVTIEDLLSGSEELSDEDLMVVQGVFDVVTKPFKSVAKAVSKAGGGLGNIAGGVLAGPPGMLASLGKAVGLPDDVVTAMSPQAAIMRGIGGGLSKGLQSRGNILQKGLAGLRGGARGGLSGAGKVVRSPLIKAVATGGAFIFPPLAAVPPAMAAGDKLLTAVESNDLTKKALGIKAVKNTADEARKGDPQAKRGLALLSVLKEVRKALPPIQASAGQQGLGYLVTVAGKALRGRFVADAKGFPGIMAIPGGRTVRGTWRRL
jgi:hypothetical protein